MDTQFLLTVMAVFTGVSAVALTVAMVAAIGVWRSVKALRERTASFMDQWEPVAKSSQEALAELRRQSSEILARVGELAEAAQDLSETAQRNIARVDETVRKTMDRVGNATAAVEQTIRAPADQLRAVSAGLNAALRQLLKGKRRDIDRIPSSDEEMFI